MRLRHLLRERDVRDRPTEQVLSVYRDFGVVPKDGRSDNFNKTPADLSNYKLVLAGDVVVNKMKAWQGSIALSEHRGIVSGDYLVCTVTGDVAPRYLHHLLRSRPMVAEYLIRSKGVRPSQWRLYWDDLADIRVDLPDLDRQRRIADYLDTETARIDALVTKKRCMIDLLRHRLARQIDEAMDLGSVPTPTLSAVVRIAEGQVDPRVKPFADLPLIAPNHVESGTGRITHRESAEEQGAISGKYLCEAGDVIYSKIRPALRKVCIARDRCLTSADMYPLRPLGGLLAGYLCYFLLSERFTDFAVMESERVAMPKINRDALGRIRIAMPSPDDQAEVVRRLDAASSWCEMTGSRLERQIALLQEQRQAQITAAVTGELEVPGLAA